MKKFILLLFIPFIFLNAQDLLKDLKLPIGKKAQKLEKKLLKKQKIIDSLKIVNADLLERNTLLEEKTESVHSTDTTDPQEEATISPSLQSDFSIMDRFVVFEDSELSDDLYLFFLISSEDNDGSRLEFRGGTISPHLLQSELMGEFEEGKHMNQKFRIIYENRKNKVWEGGADWGEWVIEKSPFLLGIEKL